MLIQKLSQNISSKKIPLNFILKCISLSLSQICWSSILLIHFVNDWDFTLFPLKSLMATRAVGEQFFLFDYSWYYIPSTNMPQLIYSVFGPKDRFYS